MALDGIFIYSIVKELKNRLINAKVDKINQPEKDEIVLTLRCDNRNTKLLISASPVFPKIHLSDNTKPNPVTAPMFCMVLRKHLTGARITDISQISSDRIVIIDFQGFDEMGFDTSFSLIVEIMGRRSNITLINKKDNIIIDCIKHISIDVNTYRCLYPGIKYIYPPESSKLDPFYFEKDALKEFITSHNLQYDAKLFARCFTGVSDTLSKELYFRLKQAFSDINSLDESTYTDYIKEFFNNIRENKVHLASYAENNVMKEFSNVELTNLKDTLEKIYTSPSELLEQYYYEKDKADRLNSKSIDLQKIVNTNLERCNKKYEILTETMDECKNKDKFRLFGELLTANIFAIKKGDTEVSVYNYYDDKYIKIKIDIDKTPSDNIQKYYKKYNKLKKSEEMAQIQLKLTQEEIEYLQSVLTNIKNADNYEEIEEIRQELIETSYIKFSKKDKAKKFRQSKPIHYISADGIDIYIGKNNYQNDFLTLKFADKHDTWLHTKNIPGSHVIIKKFGDIPDSTLEEAAALAAYFSKAKDSSKVPVDYTEVKNVKKPSGAKPGMVIYYTNKTIYIQPKNYLQEQASR